MPADADASLRIARPSKDLAAAESFYREGLGLEVLFRHEPSDDSPAGEHALLMVGWPRATWHLELTRDPRDPRVPTPTEDDLLVLYLAEPVSEELVRRLVDHGGTRVPAHNEYWNTWGVTVRDPDGYLLVLCTRDWP